MLGHQGVALPQKAKDVWPCWNKCGLVGGSMPLGLGFEVSKAQARPSGSLFLLSMDPDAELSAGSLAPACLHAAMLPAKMTIN